MSFPNVDEAFPELDNRYLKKKALAGALGATTNTNVITVATGHSSATDTRGSTSKYSTGTPFKTITAALAASVSGDLIVIHEGEYAETTSGISAVDGVDMHFMEGSHLKNLSLVANAYLFDFSGVTVNVTGEGEFTATTDLAGFGSVIGVRTSSTVTFKGKSINLVSGNSNGAVLVRDSSTADFVMSGVSTMSDGYSMIAGDNGGTGITVSWKGDVFLNHATSKMVDGVVTDGDAVTITDSRLFGISTSTVIKVTNAADVTVNLTRCKMECGFMQSAAETTLNISHCDIAGGTTSRPVIYQEGGELNVEFSTIKSTGAEAALELFAYSDDGFTRIVNIKQCVFEVTDVDFPAIIFDTDFTGLYEVTIDDTVFILPTGTLVDAAIVSTPASGSITAFASGAATTVTSNFHGMSNGETLVISGTTNYNGSFTVSGVTTNTFEISAAFVGDDATGTWLDDSPQTIAVNGSSTNRGKLCLDPASVLNSLTDALNFPDFGVGQALLFADIEAERGYDSQAVSLAVDTPMASLSTKEDVSINAVATTKTVSMPVISVTPTGTEIPVGRVYRIKSSEASAYNFDIDDSAGTLLRTMKPGEEIYLYARDDSPITWEVRESGEASGIVLSHVVGSTYKTVQEMHNKFHSTGEVTGGDVTDDADGTITVAAGTGFIRATDSNIAELYFTDWAAEAGANVNLSDGNLNYLYVEWNSGSPQVVATTTKRTDLNTNIQLATVFRDGTDLHITEANHIEVSDHASKLIQRLLGTQPFQNETGGNLAETGTRNFSISAATLWQGVTKISLGAVDTGVSDTFSYFYRDGVGGWTEVTTRSQIHNTNYDDGSGSLATLSNNRYGVHWVFQGADGDLYVVYGQGDYTLQGAEDAHIPATLPPHFEEHARVFGRVIIQKSAAVFTLIESAFNNVFQAGLPTDHNDLVNLQGGAVDDYQHLTTAQANGYAKPTAGMDWENNSALSGPISDLIDATATTLTGTADPTASTALVGSGTLFTTELAVGQYITINGEQRKVVTITDDTNLTVDVAFTDTASASITSLDTWTGGSKSGYKFYGRGFWVFPESGTWDNNNLSFDVGTTGNLTLYTNNLQPFTATAVNDEPDYFQLPDREQHQGLSDLVISVKTAEGGTVSNPKFSIAFDGIFKATS